MNKCLRSFFAVFLLGLFCATTAQAGEKRAPVIAISVISQLTTKDKNDVWSGPLIDAIKRVEDKSGQTFEKYVVPFKRAVVMTKEGSADFGVFMEGPTRNEMALPIVKVGKADYVVVTMKGHPINSLSDLSGKTIGRIRGGAAIKPLEAVPNLKFDLFSTHEDGVRLLKHGRIDALVTADFRILEAMDQGHLSLSEISRPFVVDERGLWLYWSWKSDLDFAMVKKIKEEFNVEIDGMGTSRLYQQFDSQNQ